ncbi:MAG: glutamine synthetase family protein [Minwuia sp.]|uniref:glutamine synthetase family protein n=1 Tax=Minwuia sp. TaxID=2493630 RepID=UPI003A860AFE
MSGYLSEAGLTDDDARRQAAEVLARVEAEGLESVRLVFPDPHGVLRGKTLMPGALAGALADGVTAPSTVMLKDTSQRTAFPVWQADAGFGAGALTGSGDLLLAPDPATFRTLPWAEKTGWMLCDVARRDGAPLAFAPRTVLKAALARLAAQGLAMQVGLEVEFHVFQVTDPKLSPADSGMPAAPPEVEYLTRGYGLLGEERTNALDEVIRLLRGACDGLGLPLRAVEAEFGPSQLEFVFDPGAPLEQADAIVLFRSMAKQVAARHGLHATFMSRPRLDHAAAAGWHLHQSVLDATTGRNLFTPGGGAALSDTADCWIAGLLRHARETCLITTPTVNGYKRYQDFQLAPTRIQWAHDNRGAMIRALTRPGDAASRIENRVAEPAANPYYVFASQIAGGLSGLAAGVPAPPPVEAPYADAAPRLPANLGEAIQAFETGHLFRSAFGAEFTSFYARLKRAEWERYLAEVSEWEQREYFGGL